MRYILTTLVLFAFQTATAQDWKNAEPQVFPPLLMKETKVELVNVYELDAQLVGPEEKGKVIRVVKFPSKSYTFDREGRVVEEITHNKENGLIKSHVWNEYGNYGPTKKVEKTFIYGGNKQDKAELRDTILALHLETMYLYSEEGLLKYQTTEEVNGDIRKTYEISSFEYGPENRPLRKSQNLLLSVIESVSSYSYPEENTTYIQNDRTGDIRFATDENGTLIYKKLYDTKNKSLASELNYFYKNNLLDSVSATYRHPFEGEIVETTYNRHFYYSADHKLVMQREYDKSGKMTELLYEYFQFSKP